MLEQSITGQRALASILFVLSLFYSKRRFQKSTDQRRRDDGRDESV